MTKVLPLGLSVFKFQIRSSASTKLSWFVFFFSFLISIIYAIINEKDSEIQIEYKGLQTKEGNRSYVLASFPGTNYTNLFSIILLTFMNDNLDILPINTEFCCQWFHPVKSSIIPLQYFASNDTVRLFLSGFFSYDLLTSQIHIENKENNIHSVRILYITGNPEFGEITIRIRYILSFISLACFVVYLPSLIFFTHKKVRTEQLLSLFGLLISFLSNFPLSFNDRLYDNIYAYVFSLAMKGIFHTYILVCMYLFLYIANSGKHVLLCLLLSILIVIGSGFSEVTKDTRLLGMFFEGNVIVSIYFSTVTIIGKVCICSLIVYNIIDFMIQGKDGTILFLAYGISSFFLVLMCFTSWIDIVLNHYENYSLEFFTYYSFQTILSLFYADIHWPQIPYSKNRNYQEKALDNSGFQEVSSVHETVGDEVNNFD